MRVVCIHLSNLSICNGAASNRMVAERDMVVVYWTAFVTNTGQGMGFPATGKRITVPGMMLFRFIAGKIMEE